MVVTNPDTQLGTLTSGFTYLAANPTAPVMGETGRFVILANTIVTTTGTTAISNGDIAEMLYAVRLIRDSPQEAIPDKSLSLPMG